MRQRLGATVLVLGALVLALLAGEWLLRLRFPDGFHGPLSSDNYFPWLEFDALLAWRNRPGFANPAIRVGADGLVESGATVAGSRAVHVLCLGDSRTFGIWQDPRGYRFDGGYPAPLQRLADAPGSGVSLAVWNAGTVGYTAASGLRQWLARLDGLQPDVVVAAFGFNDHSLIWNHAYHIQEPASRLARAALHGLARSRWGEAALFAWRRWLLSQKPEPRPWLTQEEYRRHLELFAEEARERRVRLLLLSIPLRPSAPGDHLPQGNVFLGAKDVADLRRQDASYREVLLGVADREHVPVLDAGPAFDAYRRSHPGPDETLYSPYDLVHPNDRGAELLARLVLDRLRELGWARDAQRSAASPSAPAAGD